MNLENMMRKIPWDDGKDQTKYDPESLATAENILRALDGQCACLTRPPEASLICFKCVHILLTAVIQNTRYRLWNKMRGEKICVSNGTPLAKVVMTELGMIKALLNENVEFMALLETTLAMPPKDRWTEIK